MLHERRHGPSDAALPERANRVHDAGEPARHVQSPHHGFGHLGKQAHH